MDVGFRLYGLGLRVGFKVRSQGQARARVYSHDSLSDGRIRVKGYWLGFRISAHSLGFRLGVWVTYGLDYRVKRE